MPMGRRRTCRRLADSARWPALRMMTLVQGHSSATTSGWRFPAATSTRFLSRRTTGPASKRTTARHSITNNRCWGRSAGRAQEFDNGGQRAGCGRVNRRAEGWPRGPSLLAFRYLRWNWPNKTSRARAATSPPRPDPPKGREFVSAFELDRDDRLLEQLGAAQHLRFGGNADRPVGEEMLQVVDVFDGVGRQADQDVVLL